jgi:hypothetical protein
VPPLPPPPCCCISLTSSINVRVTHTRAWPPCGSVRRAWRDGQYVLQAPQAVNVQGLDVDLPDRNGRRWLEADRARAALAAFSEAVLIGLHHGVAHGEGDADRRAVRVLPDDDLPTLLDQLEEVVAGDVVRQRRVRHPALAQDQAAGGSGLLAGGRRAAVVVPGGGFVVALVIHCGLIRLSG